MNRRDFLANATAAASLGLFARGRLLGQTSAAAPAPAAPPVQPPTPVTEFRALRRNVGVFTGRGGTIGWLSNKDALLAVDTQFADTAAKFLAGLPGREGRQLDAVVNTHHHWDHTGGNATMRPAAKKIVAHASVPELQQAAATRNPQMGPPTPPDTLFAEAWRMDAGDETVSARHFGAGHTGGDIIVHFERANVVHLGDLVFNRIYPVTDRPGGCRVRHWISVLETAAREYPADAMFIFGHGKRDFGVTGSRADVLSHRDFLAALVSHVEAELKAGKPRAEVVKLTNLAGFPDYFVDEKTSRLPVNLGAVYDELTGA